MPDHLCISIRFLGGAFHGRADHGEPEWPPSPLRLYQAIVAASAARWHDRQKPSAADSALRWFEQLSAPVIVAPPTHEAQGYRLYVPDNVGDLVGKSWARKNDASIADYRTEKTIRPQLIPDETAIHYLWAISGEVSELSEHQNIISETVRSITHVGWGVDLVVANLCILDDAGVASLAGERWRPVMDGNGISLRTPIAGTLDDLDRRHEAFLKRVSIDGGFTPVPPIIAFHNTDYRCDSRPPSIPRAVFALRKTDDSGFCAFNAARRGLHVAGMFRHAASRPEVVRGTELSDEDVRRIILGHGEPAGGAHKPVDGGRIAFVPLPSIEPRDGGKRVAGDIRRVLVAVQGPIDAGTFRRFTRVLEGQELIDEDAREATALTFQCAEKDGAVAPYFSKSATWSTVTPVILPGFDDPNKLRRRLKPSDEPLLAAEKNGILTKLDARIETLLKKAIRQSGFSEKMAQHAELEWRNSGFWPGTALASQYAVPKQHRRYRRLHVRITWRTPDGAPLEVSGPICIGGGRFSGLGLFAPCSS